MAELDNLNIADVIDALPFYVMLVDEEHTILQANAAVRQQFGVNLQSIIGRYCPQVVHGLDHPIDKCPLEESVRTGQIVEKELYDEESGLWVLSCIYPVKARDSSGKRLFFHTVTDITRRKNAEENLKIAQRRLRELSFHLESVREDERKELARELHDELGQLLTGLKIDLSWLLKHLPQAEPPLSARAEQMDALVDEALDTVKEVTSRLRPPVLDHLGLSAAIEWQIGQLSRFSEIKFKFVSRPRRISLDAERSTALFRICQEALTNVVRHSRATEAEINLKKERGRILLTVSDNGKGIDEKQSSAPGAFGIMGMRERVRLWEGELTIEGDPGYGSLLSVVIPLKYNGANDDKDTDS